MKDYGIDRGLVQKFDTSDKRYKGNKWGWRKMFWDYLTKLNVPFYDACCEDATTGGAPVRFTEGLERLDINTGEWEVIPFDGGSADFDSVSTDQLGSESGITVTSSLITDEGIINDTGVSRYVPFISVSVQTNVTAGTGGAIPLTSYLTTINTDAGGDAFTLADGDVVGQLKKIYLVVDGGGDAVITPANLANGTTVTFNDAGDYAVLLWDGTEWNVVENIGGTVA